MLTISKPLSAVQAHAYHHEEFRNARDNYYTTADQIRGQWHGQLARDWGLVGDVGEDHFQRLAEGQHPLTGEPLVRHRAVCTYTNERGQSVKTMAHRAGWDATFSAPKSVSLTALVGGDERIRDAHRESVAVALDALEPYVQARLGDHPAEATGNWVAATFEHDSARPVDGYAAPQLHTHVVVFNLTRTEAGEVRPVQPRELYKSQPYATAVYRAELATRLKTLGYEIDRGASGQPEIRGYTAEYLGASSPRRQQIQAQLERAQHRGAEAAEIAAHQTREAKRDRSHEAMQQRHHDMARAFGDQPTHVVHAAQALVHHQEPEPPRITAHAAVTFAKDRNLEREAVVEERALVRDALNRAMGELPFRAITREFEHRVATAEFIPVEQRKGTPGRAFTTREMIALERDTMDLMRAGQHTHRSLAGDDTRRRVAQTHPHLSQDQRGAVDQILASHDRMQALEGVAGAGKTTALAAVRDAVEREGYAVEGLAPTSRAAQQLQDAGLASSTLQRHLARSMEPSDRQKRLYVLDESSLASTRQLNAFLHRLGPEDRVLFVGDVRQHQAVDAGRPYQQLQEAGMSTARLEAIVRQKDPALKAAVEALSRGDVTDAIHRLDNQGRVHEIADRETRLAAIAREYLREPARTLIVSPDNDSRMAINQVVHTARQAAGQVDRHEHHARVLIPRQEVTGADRQWAAQYQRGDVVRYTKGSQTYGLAPGEYARVTHVDTHENHVTVRRMHGARVTYDPRRLQGVTLYREADRAFATGDRVQFTAPDRDRHIANRELATIEEIKSGAHLRLRLESGREVAFKVKAYPHLDYGYAVTSHSSQGQTADRVLVHVDLTRAGEQLINRRLAYVAISRGRYDAQIYTNDNASLAEALSGDASHRSAIEPSHAHEPSTQMIRPSPSPGRTTEETTGHRVEHQHSFGIGR